MTAKVLGVLAGALDITISVFKKMLLVAIAAAVVATLLTLTIIHVLTGIIG